MGVKYAFLNTEKKKKKNKNLITTAILFLS